MSAKVQTQVKAQSTSAPTFVSAQTNLLQKMGAGKTRRDDRFGLQTKLKVNGPGDIYEQEADKIADQVMAAPARPGVTYAPQRIQRFSGLLNRQMDAAPGSVDSVLASPGRPLEPVLRQDMEQRFGHDFSRVRVHSDAAAGQSAREVNAKAYTVGHNIVFGAGRFAPETHEGKRLITHELTHVVQQSSDWNLVHQSTEKSDLSLMSPPFFPIKRSPVKIARDSAIPEDVRGVEYDSAVQTRYEQSVNRGHGTVSEQYGGSVQPDEESGVLSTVVGGLAGEFNEKPSMAMIGVDVGVSLIPILDQASDVRDVIAHLYYLIVHRQYELFMRWLGLVFTLIGLIPELGSLIKGASKFIIGGVETVISHLGDLGRLLPDVADLGRLRAFVAHNWDSIVVQGTAVWNRTADRVTQFVSLIPVFLVGRLRMLREGWEQIIQMAPSKLAEAFDWIRRQWESVLEAVQRRLTPTRATSEIPPTPRTQHVYAEGELRPNIGAPEVVRGPRSGVQPEFSATPTPSRRPPLRGDTPPTRSTSEEIGEHIREETAYQGRSVTDVAGHTADESASLAGEIVDVAGGRFDRMERHHSVFVFLLNSIQASRTGRAARTVTRASREGFREIVDDLFPQGLALMKRMEHTDLHRALNDILDEMLEPDRVLDLIRRRGVPSGFGRGSRVVETAGTRGMMERLQHITELELVDILEEAYRRVFSEHPGMVSDEMIEEILQAIERVRRALQ